ncbi:hypothetical protein EMIT0P100_60184 [Pseudomonas sp. IT-P100]
MPPKSVGASVDKVFAILCEPLKPWPARIRSKNNQSLLKTLLLDKSRIFFSFRDEYGGDKPSCPHLLWVDVWITCWLTATAPYPQQL